MLGDVLFVNFDKVQAEWVVVAYLSEDAEMLRILREGRDPHTATGHLISGASEEVVIAESKAVGHSTDPIEIDHLRARVGGLDSGDLFLPRTMSIRQAGKKSNHGLNLNMGYVRFARENEMDYSDAKQCVAAYHHAYPNIRGVFHKRVQQHLQKDRTLINCFGDPRRFLNAWGEKLFDAAYAYLPQSTVLRMTNAGLVYMARDDLPDFMRPAELMMQVHDSILIQYWLTGRWEDLARCIAALAEQITPVCEYYGRKFTIKTDYKIGLSAGDRGMHEVVLVGDISQDAKILKEAWQRIRDEPKAA